VTVINFTVSFHGPFRVGAAYARDGVDAALDHDEPLPADHLKGVMRAAACSLLAIDGQDPWAVAEVFGSARAPSPWSWSSATVDEASGQTWTISRRHRVTIDPDTHSARKDHLVLGEQAWAPTAGFQVARVGLLNGTLAEDEHVLILRCAAAAVHGLGAWRRRGLGWVGIIPKNDTISAYDVRRLLMLRRGVR
jgi:hypothetical protein